MNDASGDTDSLDFDAESCHRFWMQEEVKVFGASLRTIQHVLGYWSWLHKKVNPVHTQFRLVQNNTRLSIDMLYKGIASDTEFDHNFEAVAGKFFLVVQSRYFECWKKMPS